MKRSKRHFFHELHVESIEGSIIVLDIDGTIMCSSSKIVDQSVKDVIKLLQQKNTVYVFSNNFNGQRSRMIAKQLQLPYIESPYKKPHKKILNYIEHAMTPIVTIGDKYLTDGLFAQFIHAKHIRVSRYRCAKDSFADRSACAFDDCVYFGARICGFVKKDDFY